METDESVIEIKGNYLRTVSLKRLSFPYPPKASLIFQFIHLYIHPRIDPSIHHLSIHPSAAALFHPCIHPLKSSQATQWANYRLQRKLKRHLASLTRRAVSKPQAGPSWTPQSVGWSLWGEGVGVRTSGEDGHGRVQVSGPIGVRWWRLHLPKQTAQRSRVLHLSPWITPLSHPPVSERPVLTSRASKFIRRTNGPAPWNVKLQHWSDIIWNRCKIIKETPERLTLSLNNGERAFRPFSKLPTFCAKCKV